MEVKTLGKIETYQFALWTLQIANKAVRRTQEENRKLGVPNVYYINGVTYYEINGEMITKSPFDK